MFKPGPRTELLRSRLRRLVLAVTAVARDLARNDLTLHATGLVYTTLLSLVPLLAFSFALLKGLGVHNQIEPMLMSYLAPMGEQGEEVALRIVGFIDRMQVGVLGSVGLGMLVFTAVSLVHRVEVAFNRVWRIERSRPLLRRVSDYVSTLVVGPLLVFSALGVTAAVSNSAAFQQMAGLDLLGPALNALIRLVPYIMIIGAFTFVYLFIPNTRVRPGAAFVGAAVAGFLWGSLGWGFATFVAGADQYTAIYSSFAILILFMLWLYLSWLVMLVGADIAYHWQNPGAPPAAPDAPALQPRDLALSLLCLLSRRYTQGLGPADARTLAAALDFGPEASLRALLEQLTALGWVARTDAPTAGYLLACPAVGIGLDHLLLQLDRVDEASADPALQALREEWAEALRTRFQGRTLADICRGADSD